MKVYNIHEAKTHFSKLIEQVEKGEQVTIARSGKVVAKLVSAKQPAPRIRLGSLAGEAVIPADFDAVDGEVENLFHGAD